MVLRVPTALNGVQGAVVVGHDYTTAPTVAAAYAASLVVYFVVLFTFRAKSHAYESRPSRGTHHAPSAGAACSRSLILQMYTYGTPCAVSIDTGAECNLFTERVYLKQLYNVPLFYFGNTLQAVQGSPINAIDSVILRICFHTQDCTIYFIFV